MTRFFDWKRDTFIRPSELERGMAPLFEAIIERFEANEKDVARLDAEVGTLHAEVKALRAALETERRLRLAMRK